MTELGDALLTFSPFTLGSAVIVVADVAAFFSIWRSRVHAARSKVIWTALVGLLPVLGAVAWFALGRMPRR